jgi:hypothetical protein
VRRRSKLSGVIVGTLLLTSCPSGGGGAQNANIDELPPPNPLDVSIRTNPAKAQTKVLGPAGGTLRLRLADGTEVHLKLPAGALVFDTEIGMAPAAIEGWGFAPTGLAAVQLSPEGLDLLVPASLSFRRAETDSSPNTGQIAWAANGIDLHPIPASDALSGATIPIDHFSGYGFAWDLTESYWGDWEQYRGRTWEAYIEQILAGILNQERQRQFILGEDPLEALDQMVMGMLNSWYDWVYTSLMSSAETSCANGRAAAAAQITLSRRIALIGGDMHDLWQRFSDARRSKGLPLPFTFDGLPFDFIDRLTATCDREALDACLQTGDLGLLLAYLKNRNTIIELATGQETPNAGSGSDMIKKCARFHVEFDVTVGFDNKVFDPEHPVFEERDEARVQLSVDLHWEPADPDPNSTNPWIGRVVGEAVPKWTSLIAERRNYDAFQNDQGKVTGHWHPWCVIPVAVGPWEPWPVELKGLDFNRERVQRLLPPPLPGVEGQNLDQSQRLGPTFNYEEPLTTISFKSATLVFDELPLPTERAWSCGFTFTAEDSFASDLTGPFLVSQPRDTKWAATYQGLSASPVELKGPGSHPEIARRVWTDDPRTEVKDTGFGARTILTTDWTGTLTLTHLPLGGD